MSDDLRGGADVTMWNKVQHKRDVLESSPNQPPVCGKIVFTGLVPVKCLGDRCSIFFPKPSHYWVPTFKKYLKSTYFSPTVCHSPVLVTWVTSVNTPLCVYWDSFPSSWNANCYSRFPKRPSKQNPLGNRQAYSAFLLCPIIFCWNYDLRVPVWPGNSPGLHTSLHTTPAYTPPAAPPSVIQPWLAWFPVPQK